ncbi:fimbrial protein [Acinetobacter sp. ANC 4558]|uniref:fimbria/pilus outer membrane usher protein n=1 Tax=Acinetobacter sp. ANC 4558 TaxID=1977876 RepID=UPI000A33F775|nr:fimbria/pilus outer membrane usher protein [Acinetobacter sp. ANC 4558]OTG82482.1 fimbrial protein [Acinetobacter sp. ANC 4558]
MKKNKQNYKWIKHNIAYYMASGAVIISFPVLTYADQTSLTQPTITQAADFDSNFLIGDHAQHVNIDRFKYGNPILPGEYNVDVYLNQNWKRKQRIVFKAIDQKSNAFTCFTASNLLEFGVKTDILKQKVSDLSSPQCLKINEWIEDASYEFDSSTLRIDISIPQIALQQNAQGYIDPSVWDRGINAAFLSYNASAYKSFNASNNANTTNAFSSIYAGLNIAGWQLRHNGQWQWRDSAFNNNSSSSYDSVSTYLQRAFPQYRGVLTLGDNFTNGEIFDSFGYRGMDFSSDDRMLPDSMLGYAPRIRGYAKTNAKVEVHQQGQIIYQSTVAAGNFEINDLYPTGFGGELKVSVIESDGSIQTFTVPYASVVQMLRPGMKRYALTLGQFRDKDINSNPAIFQGKFQLGINNYLTGFAGIQVAKNYQAISTGAAFATPIGAVALDVTHSQAKFENRKDLAGQSYRLSYSKLIVPTNTNFTLAAYRYSTENFYKLRDALLINDFDKRGLSSNHIGKQRSEFQITLNQGLPNNLGNFYATGSWTDYWNRNESQRQYQIGYSNTYHGLTYGLSALKREVRNTISGDTNNDTEYMMTLSLPLTFKKSSININSITTPNNTTLGVSGMIGNRFSYGASTSDQFGENPSFNTNAQYKTNFATFGGSYSIANSYQQAMVSARGNVVAHAHGVHFGADQGQTMVLVYAPDAVGAQVNNSTGLTINKSGYAVIPYVTPYRLNNITLDPQNMSTNVELLENSQRIAPYDGAISKVNFATKSGKAFYIHSVTTDGKNIPFAAEVYNSNNENIGMVAQGSLVYIRTNHLKDVITVKWGDDPTEQCKINYDVNTDAKTENVISLETICQ